MWTNNGFRRRSMGTPSYMTGPQSANTGEYYAYFETSSPAMPGNTVTLSSQNDLSGCFCLKFYHQHAVAEDMEHSFHVSVNEEIVLSIEESDDEWEEYYVQVDLAGPVQITFVGTRGSNWQGDTAIDDISLTPGMCAEEEDD
uniref:MAM domain-containing protein n=1 Tax=Ciona savignyi TaxID=51511 RepID=H2Y9K4_CIOSA